jgi:hypothetical protein
MAPIVEADEVYIGGKPRKNSSIEPTPFSVLHGRPNTALNSFTITENAGARHNSAVLWLVLMIKPHKGVWHGFN